MNRSVDRVVALLVLSIAAFGAVRAQNQTTLVVHLNAATSNAPISAAVVSAKAQAAEPVFLTFINGQYEVRGLAPGDYSLKAKAPQFSLQERKITVAEGSNEFTLQLSQDNSGATATSSQTVQAPSDNDAATKGNGITHPYWLEGLENNCASMLQLQFCFLIADVYSDGTKLQSDPKIAMSYLQQACDLGSPTACSSVGRPVPGPFPYPPSGNAIISNFEAVLNEGQCVSASAPQSCLLAGVAYSQGSGVPADAIHAKTYFDKACNLGNQQGCSEAKCQAGDGASCRQSATAWANGSAGFINLNRAAFLFKRQCDSGDKTSCSQLTSLPTSPAAGPIETEVVSRGARLASIRDAARGCDSGAGPACRMLAEVVRLGVDGQQNEEAALRYLDRACSLNDSWACTRLGRLYRDRLAQPDSVRADTYFRSAYNLNKAACQMGVPPFGCFGEGDALVRGEGVAVDRAQGLSLIDQDCTFWQAGFICGRAVEIRSGQALHPGVEELQLKAPATAISTFFARDCDQGGVASCETLGRFYASGHGVDRNHDHAASLLRGACAKGNQTACNELASLGGPDSQFAAEALCKMGNSDQCVVAADALVKLNDPSKVETAFGLYESGCMTSAPGGCAGMIVIGDMYRTGQVASQNLTRAREIYTAACAIERNVACEKLAAMASVAEQQGNEDAALDEYIDSCASGGSPGCNNVWRIANKYQQTNPSRYRAVWQKTCDRHPSIVDACHNLAYTIEMGIGGAKDQLRALGMYDDLCHKNLIISCNAYYNLEGALNTTVYDIAYPPVNQPSTEFRSYLFRANDQVFIQAGGCVQTGGWGKTWKRYVDPIAPDSPQLYHGKIWIPGVTGNGLENFPGYLNTWKTLKPGNHDPSDLFLRLGYDDKPDQYGDNGYYDHDDGTDDQCKNVGAAYVRITVRHHSRPPVSAEVVTDPIYPMDLVFDSIDDNLVGVNPKWGEQVLHPGNLPEAGGLCNQFKETASGLDLHGCTQHMPTIDRITIDLQDVIENIPRPWVIVGRSVMYAICQSNLEQHDPIDGDSVHGHVNWGVASYDGKLYFEDFQVPPLSIGVQLIGDGDGDYDFDLIRDDQAGVLAHNPFQYHGVGNRGLTVEFDSSEVIDKIGAGWWQALHTAVDSHPANSGDWTAPQALVDGKEVKIVGLMGVDTKHWYHAEIHPVFGMAVKVAEDSNREVWEIFARNWGDEGGCSRYLHYTNTNKLTFFFPKKNGVTLIADPANSSFWGYDAVPLWGAKSYDDGLVVAFQLPPQQQQGLIVGELHVCKNACGSNPPALNFSAHAERNNLLRTENTTGTGTHEQTTDEGNVKPLITTLTAAEQDRFFQYISNHQPAPANAANNRLALRREAAVRATVAATRDDSIAVERHRQLAQGEKRLLVQTTPRDDMAQIQKGIFLFHALEYALSDQQKALNVVRQLVPLPNDLVLPQDQQNR